MKTEMPPVPKSLPTRQIYRYTLELGHHSVGFMLPRRAEVLTVGKRRGVPSIWFIADSDAPLEMQEFFVARSGIPIPGWCGRECFVGTVEYSVEGTASAVALHVFRRSDGV